KPPRRTPIENVICQYVLKSGGAPPHSTTCPPLRAHNSRLRLGVRRCSAALGASGSLLLQISPLAGRTRRRKPTPFCRLSFSAILSPIRGIRVIRGRISSLG